jgi:hypothetical protein
LCKSGNEAVKERELVPSKKERELVSGYDEFFSNAIASC